MCLNGVIKLKSVNLRDSSSSSAAEDLCATFSW